MSVLTIDNVHGAKHSITAIITPFVHPFLMLTCRGHVGSQTFAWNKGVVVIFITKAAMSLKRCCFHGYMLSIGTGVNDLEWPLHVLFHKHASFGTPGNFECKWTNTVRGKNDCLSAVSFYSTHTHLLYLAGRRLDQHETQYKQKITSLYNKTIL